MSSSINNSNNNNYNKINFTCNTKKTQEDDECYNINYINKQFEQLENTKFPMIQQN